MLLFTVCSNTNHVWLRARQQHATGLVYNVFVALMRHAGQSLGTELEHNALYTLLSPIVKCGSSLMQDGLVHVGTVMGWQDKQGRWLELATYVPNGEW